MPSRIRRIELEDWFRVPPGTDLRAEVEDGQVLWFPRLAFVLEPAEQALLQPALLEPGRRNINLDRAGQLKGAVGDAAVQARVAAARRYLPQARAYSPVQARLLRTLRVTESLRSEYDHLMLQLHDRMKADEAYQREAPQESFGFPAGSTWVCFSDQTVHAAMAGQYLLEQTLHLPVDRQRDVAASPLAILTRLAGRPLRGAPLAASKA